MSATLIINNNGVVMKLVLNIIGMIILVLIFIYIITPMAMDVLSWLP